jgi:MFS family permease
MSTSARRHTILKPLVREADPEAAEAPRSGTFAALTLPHYPRLWSIGLLWNLGRWMALFLCAYLVNQLTHSPVLIQLVGACFFAPMFFAGALGGVISDRLDRRKTLRGFLFLVIPSATAMAGVTLAGEVRVWMVYPFMVVIGIGMVLDMTSRRALVYDLVGPRHVTNALALESMAYTGGTLFGGVTAGTIISLLGIGQAFVLVAAFYAVSLVVMLGLPRVTAGRNGPAASSGGISRDLRSAFALLRDNRTLVSILGVTVVMNLCYFPFTPMVPLFAERLGANAFWTGVLAGGPAVGSVIGTLVIARGLAFGRGLAYVGGSAVGLVCLGVFAASGWYPLALVALVCAGLGISGFATMQSVLVMVTAGDEMRGRALGLLSMSIGALPFAMLMLGGLAQAMGPVAGVVTISVTGLLLLAIWARLRPESQRLA